MYILPICFITANFPRYNTEERGRKIPMFVYLNKICQLIFSKREVLAARPADPSPWTSQAWWKKSRNTYEPHCITGKPTFGYYFSWGTDHRRRRFGIESVNLNKDDPINSLLCL